MNSAHPMENPTVWTNFLTTFAMMLFPFSLVLMLRPNAESEASCLGNLLGNGGIDGRDHYMGDLL